MATKVDAIYENGVLRPLQPLDQIKENSKVKITVELEQSKQSLEDCLGIMPDEDAAEMLAIIEDEFEKVNPDEWR